MTEKELEKKNPCGDGKEIDEYLDGTICELAEEVEDIEVSDDGDFEVDSPPEPEKLEDPYVG